MTCRHRCPGGLAVRCCVRRLCRYKRQGRKAKNRRSRDSYSNRAYSRTQTVRNTGTHNLPLHLTRATIKTNDLDTLVHIGDLSPRQHRTARSSCQEVSTTTIHRPLTLDQRHAEFPMCTSQEESVWHLIARIRSSKHAMVVSSVTYVVIHTR